MLINKIVGILNVRFWQVITGSLLKKIMNNIIMISKKIKSSEINNGFSQCTGGKLRRLEEPNRSSQRLGKLARANAPAF